MPWLVGTALSPTKSSAMGSVLLRRNICPALGWCAPSTRSPIRSLNAKRTALPPGSRYRLPVMIRKQCKLRRDWCAMLALIRWRSASWLMRAGSSAARQDMARTWARLNSSRSFRWRHDSSHELVTARGACDGARTFGRAMVLRVFLYTACRLLCLASAARPDGHRRWRQEPAVALYRHVSQPADRAATLRRAGGETAAGQVYFHRLPFLRRQPGSVLGVADLRRRKGDRSAGIFCLGQRIQLVRGGGVLVVHGRPVYCGARQAAVRVHWRRRHRWSAPWSRRHDLAVSAARPSQPVDRGRRLPRSSRVLCPSH